MLSIHTVPGLIILLFLTSGALSQPINNTTGEECNVNSDCETDKICVDLKCTDPCYRVCGNNTVCVVQDLLPVCSCKSGHEGDPFTECKPVNVECTENAQCPVDKTCLNQRCVDPCVGACGVNSDCRVANHRPMCACLKGFVFSPQAGCKPKRIPDCQMNNHCPEDRTCRQQMCVDPCEEIVCGNNTVCSVKNHYPVCACKQGFVGDALNECVPACSAGKRVDGKKTFLISDNKATWMDATNDCYSRGMYLATIDSEEESDALAEAWLSKYNTRSPEIWLGAHDLGNYQRFVWVSTGKHFSYTKFKDGEPTNSECHCLLAQDNFSWISHYCTTLYYYACESVK